MGIGGIGMSALARMSLKFNIRVSGSDAFESDITQALSSEGAQIFIGHKKENVQDCSLLVYSSAVKSDNPERQIASEKKIREMRRADFLGLISNEYKTLICAAGTHGKTSISSIITSMLYALQLDPSALIGGIMNQFNSNARIGSDNNYLVVEADEYDRSFLTLSPTISIISSVDEDHLDIYDGKEDIQNTFLKYSRQIRDGGRLILCIDDPGLNQLQTKFDNPFTYAIDNNTADVKAVDINMLNGESKFKVRTKGLLSNEFTLTSPGKHNILNALSAISTGILLGYDVNQLIPAIASFRGVQRRFELKTQVKNIRFYDDYAHHPTEVLAAIHTARNIAGEGRVVVIFQPHLFSRTQDFAAEFAEALALSDLTILMDIYPAREKPIEGVSSQLIYDKMSPSKAVSCATIDDVQKYLINHTAANDLVLCLGAGDLSFHIEALAKNCSLAWEKKENNHKVTKTQRRN